MDMDIARAAGKLFPLLFMMMGPIGLMPNFAALTTKMDEAARKEVATRAAMLSLAALAVAVFVGGGVLDAWGVSKGSLILAAGVVLILSVVKPIIAGGGHGAGAGANAKGPRELAVSPLAFPTIVSPQAVGVLVIFVAFYSSIEAKAVMFAVALAIIAIDYGAMRIAHWFMSAVGMVPLLVLGAVFGILQVALGVEMIAYGVIHLVRC